MIKSELIEALEGFDDNATVLMEHMDGLWMVDGVDAAEGHNDDDTVSLDIRIYVTPPDPNLKMI